MNNQNIIKESEIPDVEQEEIEYNEYEENAYDNYMHIQEKDNSNEMNLNNNDTINLQTYSKDVDNIKLIQESQEPIYVMTLELDQNKSANIKIFSDSIPYELAYEFCKVNNLDYKSLNFLATEIENLMTSYQSKISANANRYVGNLHDEIVELEEEQIATEKNRDTEEKENLNYLNIDDQNTLEEKENLIENKINEVVADSQSRRSDLSATEKMENNFEENVINSHDYEYNSNKVDEDNQDLNHNKINEHLNSEQADEILNSVDNVNNNKNQNIYEQEDIIEEVSNIVYENLDELNKSNRDIREKYEEYNNGLSTPEPEKLETYETQKIQKNSRKSSSRANQRDDNITSNIVNSQSDFYQSNCLRPENNLSKNNNYNPQYNSVMFSYPSNNNLNSNDVYINSNRSNSINRNTNKKLNIFDRLFKEAQYKRILPKHGRSYKTYHTELENNDKTNQLKTKHGQLIYYKEKVIKEEQTRKLSKSKSEYVKQIKENNSNYNYNSILNSNINSNPIQLNSKIPKHASNYFLNTLTVDYSNTYQDLNKTINKKKTTFNNVKTREDNLSNRQYLTDVNKKEEIINNEREIESNYFKKRNHSCSIKDNINKSKYDNNRQNASFSITKFKPYKNLFENEEKQKFKKLLTIQKIKNETENNFTFKPIVSKKFQCDLNFQQRQEIYRVNSNNRKKEIEEILNNPTDDKGGPLFHPKLITDHTSNHFINKNNSYKNVFEKNYEYANKYQQNKENLKKKYDNEQDLILIQNRESEEIFEKLKEDAFRNLFRDLDNDQDDLITTINIGINYLPSEIRKIINPILLELKEENETLNENEFVKAMSLLFDMLNYNDKKIIIQKYKNKYVTERGKRKENEINSFMFKPIINRNSKKLADNNDRKLIQSMSQQNLIKSDGVMSNKNNINMNSNSYFRMDWIDKSKAMEKSVITNRK